MRLIDADALKIDFYDEYETEDDAYAYGYVSKHQIDMAPTIDAVSVVHGEWIAKYEGSYLQRRMYCSVCGKRSGIGGIKSNQLKPYCPNCGAKMDGEREGE